MGVEEHKCKALKNLNCAVLTISDTRTEETDESGKYIIKVLRENGHSVVSYGILKDDFELIRNGVQELLEKNHIQVIITNGSTGISKRDVATDVISPLLEKKLNGFGELFRALSYKEIGSASMMSRAIAGSVKGKIIICIPGSINAVKLAMNKLIIPELGHLVWEANR